MLCYNVKLIYLTSSNITVYSSISYHALPTLATPLWVTSARTARADMRRYIIVKIHSEIFDFIYSWPIGCRSSSDSSVYFRPVGLYNGDHDHAWVIWLSCTGEYFVNSLLCPGDDNIHVGLQSNTVVVIPEEKLKPCLNIKPLVITMSQKS